MTYDMSFEKKMIERFKTEIRTQKLKDLTLLINIRPWFLIVNTWVMFKRVVGPRMIGY